MAPDPLPRTRDEAGCFLTLDPLNKTMWGAIAAIHWLISLTNCFDEAGWSASLAHRQLKIDNDHPARRLVQAYSGRMCWAVYCEHKLNGYWVVTDHACHKTRAGPFTLESDAVSAAVDTRSTIRAVYGFGAFAPGELSDSCATKC